MVTRWIPELQEIKFQIRQEERKKEVICPLYLERKHLNLPSKFPLTFIGLNWITSSPLAEGGQEKCLLQRKKVFVTEFN